MEDILASIRRILSEDEPPAAPPAPDPEPESGTPPKEDKKNVLILDPSMMVEEPQPTPAPVEPTMSPDAPPEPAYPHQPAAAAAPAAGSGLVAPEAAAAAASSVGHLVRALTERSTQVHQGGPTLEDLVRDEIRPILKQWLDAHLPPIVERMVRVEIERVVGRAVP